ncbi:polyketide cyclase / dehydrase and lipid transport domain-containing protein [Trichoderma breve]|uniref:Polyketide cyclase / dehydrase and lipid transport domain-containing protein n=1 Tax=Trichoderma breve TaxID=2034170 RepID=A0A9W9E9J9_9HYPO|nr:polyketide cyclase / dehydrase and lipid transport domain-containing protein [Trichoderma breve]KAJ4859896.1 polyketide cyclase / dehydrase and lipid transport domain-containing protein [Trichoderma breve]
MSPILSVSTKIEIAASPAAVRSVFLDFARYTQWKPGWIIQPVDANKQPLDLKPGDGLKVSMDGKAHNPVVVENSPKSFQWEGSLFGLGKGVHQFHFEPSETNPGGTTFTQGEDFRGLLITLSSPWWSGRKFDMDPWDKFNADLKNEVEKSSN